MSHRRLFLTIAFTIALAVVAMIVLVVPASFAGGVPVDAVPQAPPPPAYSGPSAELVRAHEMQQIADAVKADAEARWNAAVEANRQAAAEEAARAAARTSARGTGRTGPGQVLDGDRFDRLSTCESGQNPTDLSPGGKYRGAFQFSLPTWHAAGMSGDPIDYSYADQKAAAMSWAQVADPSGQWPVCWPRSA